ncbi:MAG: type II secretion system protein N [Woeseiaceae bacterium]|nr:type II secretion system protein N [Woeseiaceae bacterium]
MKLNSRLLIVGTVTLLVGVLVMFPARVAYHWASPPGVAIAGIQGTIWNGRALEGEAAGMYLRNIGWRMKPLALFKGQLAFAIEADAASGFVNGDVALSAGGSAILENLTASLSLQALQQIVGMPGLEGAASLRFDRLEFADGFPVAANGEVEVANVRVPMVHRSPLGGFRVEFFTQDTGIMASVEDADAVVDLAGSFSLGLDRAYQFVGQVAPTSETPTELREQMRFLGSADERGNHEFRFEGQLEL